MKTTFSEMPRRGFLAARGTTLTVVCTGSWAAAQPNGDEYGDIGKIVAVKGTRGEVIEEHPERYWRHAWLHQLHRRQGRKQQRRDLDFRSVGEQGQPRRVTVASIRESSDRQKLTPDRRLR